MLELSAGTGSLVAAATHPGVKIVANELAPRRFELLKALVGDEGRVTRENAKQLDNILPADMKPTVVVMNPTERNFLLQTVSGVCDDWSLVAA